MRSIFRNLFPGGYNYEDRGYYDGDRYTRRGGRTHYGQRPEGKWAGKICLAISIFALIMIVLGLIFKNPYFFVAGIFPAAIYEFIRTEGYYTRFASIIILIITVLEILAITGVFNINFAKILGQESINLGDYVIHITDAGLVYPLITTLLSFSLLFRTWGTYTKWLAIVLTACSVCLLYVVNKEMISVIIQNYTY